MDTLDHQGAGGLVNAQAEAILHPPTFIAIGAVSAAVLLLILGTTPRETIEDVVIGPVVGQHFVCMEHPQGQLPELGDALGSDCLVPQLDAGPHRRFPRFYSGDGRQNEDWVGWNAPVLAPFDGVVDSVHVNPVSNRPGTAGTARATILVFRRADGVRVLYAHLQRVSVRQGDSVRAGDVVAHVGNNGPAWFPHTHIGAWKWKRPLQIRFDLAVMGKMSRSK
jgi:peptidase M23-like protein